jgi:poly-gamma-glutamate capsule biosynthesis protein CapA/YwtB (metallophosphatase superfamily)
MKYQSMRASRSLGKAAPLFLPPTLLLGLMAIFALSATPSPGASPVPVPGSLSLKAVGDIMLARSIGERLERQGVGSVFGPFAKELSGADILAGNLECAISERGSPEPKHYTFRAPPLAAKALSLAGFGVVALANNHAMDYGPEALLDTIAALDAQGMAHAGAGRDDAEAHRPAILERRGIRVAFLAYADVPVERAGYDVSAWKAGPRKPGIAWADKARIAADVKKARSEAEIVVVFLHSGIEGSTVPSPNQRAEAYAALDSGAALVIGSHPHVRQGAEQRGSGYVAYSLGNFIFDEFDPQTGSGALLSCLISPKGTSQARLIPLKLY